jgi:hypothetical protein
MVMMVDNKMTRVFVVVNHWFVVKMNFDRMLMVVVIEDH